MTSPDFSVRFPALGTSAVLAVADSAGLAGARAAVEETIAAFDLACSRFRDDSELSAVNAAAGRAIPVGPLLLDAVEAALRAARVTDGAVDPTVGEALIALGYDRDFESIGSGGAATASIASVPGWQTGRVDHHPAPLSPPPGRGLDLGATAQAP